MDEIAALLVAADGGNSMVRRQLDPRFDQAPKLCFIQRVFRGELDAEPEAAEPVADAADAAEPEAAGSEAAEPESGD